MLYCALSPLMVDRARQYHCKSISATDRHSRLLAWEGLSDLRILYVRCGSVVLFNIDSHPGPTVGTFRKFCQFRDGPMDPRLSKDLAASLTANTLCDWETHCAQA